MKCKHCGAQLSENAKFCAVCGNKVEREIVKQNKIKLTSDEVHNQKKEKYTGAKGGIFAIVLLLCAIVVGTGFFYYKNKGDSTNISDDKRIEKSKKNTANEYEDFENGTENSFSAYYDGYIYYRTGNYLYRENPQDVGETETLYDFKGENTNFVIMDGDIYIDDYEETEGVQRLIKRDSEGNITILTQQEGETYLYTDGEAVYYCTWNSEENSERGRVEKINKQGEKTELFELPKEYMESMYHMADRRYVYYYVEDGIKRIDITQKTCNPELALKETENQQTPDDFSPYNDKIYYRDVYSDDPTWYEYDINTQTNKAILTESMFENEGGDFRIINFKGVYAYIESDGQEEEPESDIYKLNLKTDELKWIKKGYYNAACDICNNYLIFSTYDRDNDETGLEIAIGKEKE